MRYLESQLQRAFFQWQRLAYPDYYYQCFAIPNGGKRNLREAVRLKAEGVCPGVADVFVAIPFKHLGTTWHGLFIEFKIIGNDQTKHQADFMLGVSKFNYLYEVVVDLDRAMWLFKLAVENQVSIVKGVPF
jgi:hypothetical protein